MSTMKMEMVETGMAEMVEDFKELLVKEFCASNAMEKMELEFWNHAMVGDNHAAYTDRFHELAKLVPNLLTPKSKRMDRYIRGLVPQIYEMIRATQPAIIQRAILKDRALIDETVRCVTLSKSVEKRKETEGLNCQTTNLVNAKEQEVQAGQKLEEAFQTLKDNLCNAPILTLLDGPDEFVVIVMCQIKDLDVCLCKGVRSSEFLRLVPSCYVIFDL
ncbi:hypothetical protein Tco_1005358 [Tanacetum coccineum]|uniref:Reverse transcriptase domain-containing protein n=1 Tax=Tanacetum coccineum TaxID=301880 RepID=A0ABQ5FEM6_9ASTR